MVMNIPDNAGVNVTETTKMQSTGSSVAGGGGAGAPGSSGGAPGTTATAAYPIDLASASKVLVRPTEKTMPTTYR